MPDFEELCENELESWEDIEKSLGGINEEFKERAGIDLTDRK